jgi:CheY-like chemotaxis protein
MKVLTGKTILIVDDEEEIREILALELEDLGAHTLQAGHAEEALQVFGAHRVDLVLSDIHMPGASGVKLLQRVRSRTTVVPVVLMTGFADITLPQAQDLGAETLLQKPFDLSLLGDLCQHILGEIPSRWKGLPSGQRTYTVAKGHVLYGRGGLTLHHQFNRPLVGEHVTLQLEEGAFGVVCKWWQNVDGWGGEIESWDEAARAHGWPHSGLIPYIPLYKAR